MFSKLLLSHIGEKLFSLFWKGKWIPNCVLIISHYHHVFANNINSCTVVASQFPQWLTVWATGKAALICDTYFPTCNLYSAQIRIIQFVCVDVRVGWCAPHIHILGMLFLSLRSSCMKLIWGKYWKWSVEGLFLCRGSSSAARAHNSDSQDKLIAALLSVNPVAISTHILQSPNAKTESVIATCSPMCLLILVFKKREWGLNGAGIHRAGWF